MAMGSSNYPFRVDCWYCCLNPAERQVMRKTAEHFRDNETDYVDLLPWLAFWPLVVPSGMNRTAVFIILYKLENSTRYDDILQVDVPIIKSTDGVFWQSVITWLGEGGDACPSGCELIPAYLRVG